jgi:hypothetical protein
LPHRRGGLAPRCRIVASWGCSRSQGSGCSPVKAVRDLGSERRILRRHRVIDGCPLAISVKPDVGLDRDRRGNTEGSRARVRLDPVTTESVSSRSCVSVAQATNLRPRSHANSSQYLCKDEDIVYATRNSGTNMRETVRSLSAVGVTDLRSADPSTRGPGWTYR